MDAPFFEVLMKTTPYGLIGKHLSHSYSVPIHQALGNKEYSLMEIAPKDLPDFLKRKEFRGINVTIPYKQDVFEYLDEADPLAVKAGACNCIVNKDGRLCGYNTDIDGIQASFEKMHVSPENKNVLIFGCGGAAKAFDTWAKSHFAQNVYQVSRRNKPGTLTMDQAKAMAGDIDIIINATPVDMYPNNEGQICDLADFPNVSFVMDAVYNPFETRLLAQARELGIPAISGLDMLAAQAISAHEKFFDVKVDPAKQDEITLDLYKSLCNIALTGLPSSGKSTLARILGEKLGRLVVEMDDQIESSFGKPIHEVFEQDGEAVFRQREKEVTAAAARQRSQILSCGGGVVLDEDNIKALQSNSIVIYVRRPLDMLISEDPTRPTLKQGLENLYEKRNPLYEKAADLIVDNTGTPEQTADAILELLNDPKTYARFSHTAK